MSMIFFTNCQQHLLSFNIILLVSGVNKLDTKITHANW